MRTNYKSIPVQGGIQIMRKRKFTRQVGVVMSEETYELLTRITNTREVPMSEFIRGIVENTLQEMVKEGDGHGS
jgi:hypothetical protein